MASFDLAFQYVIRNEDAQLSGAVTEEPGGGIAKWGINSKANPGVDVFNLTYQQALAIYQRQYWAPAFALLKSQRVATKLLDAVVNLGFEMAVKLAQRAVNRYSIPALTEDGKFGPNTLNRVNAEPELVFLDAFVAMLRAHYYAIVQAKPEDEKYLAAWLKRAEKLPAAEKGDVVAIA